MPSDAALLATIKSQTLAVLADLTLNPKPSYNIDGQDVKWTAYQRMLLDKLETLNALINAESPYEIHSVGYTP